MCKRGDTFSLAILIGRGLDLCFSNPFFAYFLSQSLFSFQGVLKMILTASFEAVFLLTKYFFIDKINLQYYKKGFVFMLYPIEEIYNIILKRRKPFKTFFIGIDGGVLSGKSVFAELLSKLWPINVYVVHMDEFYMPSERINENMDCMGGRWDIQRLKNEVFIPLSEDKDTEYRVFDKETDFYVGTKKIIANGIVIVEGSCSLISELIKFYNYSVWIGAPRNFRLERAVKRDGEAMRQKYDEVWMPAEEYYFSYQEPLDYVDLIIDGTGEGADIRKREVNVIRINNLIYNHDKQSLL